MRYVAFSGTPPMHGTDREHGSLPDPSERRCSSNDPCQSRRARSQPLQSDSRRASRDAWYSIDKQLRLRPLLRPDGPGCAPFQAGGLPPLLQGRRMRVFYRFQSTRHRLAQLQGTVLACATRQRVARLYPFSLQTMGEWLESRRERSTSSTPVWLAMGTFCKLR